MHLRILYLLFFFSASSLLLVAQTLENDIDEFYAKYISEGKVNYDQIKQQTTNFEQLISRVKKIDWTKFDQTTQQAFLINAYNLYVIKAVVDRYPISSPKAVNGFFTKKKYRLFDEVWENTLRENPTFASSLGDKRYNDKWGDNSLAAYERRHKENIATLARLNKIDRSELSVSDQLNYDLFQKDYEKSIESFKFKGYLLPINPIY